MNKSKIYSSATTAWLEILRSIIEEGTPSSPRGMSTLEVMHNPIGFDMNYPVLSVPARKISYAFMAAEAYWILTGDNRVSTIAPFNKNIAKFSDDGETFFGAYGIPIIDQYQHVVGCLNRDLDSRQAVINLWRENPPPLSRDIPCTLSMTFSVRRHHLFTHVFMRSSDAWLGIPYDFFNYTMISLMILTKLNWLRQQDFLPPVVPGHVFWTAASSHLYEPDLERAKECLYAPESDFGDGPRVPETLWRPYQNDSIVPLLSELRAARDGQKGRFWDIREGKRP